MDTWLPAVSVFFGLFAYGLPKVIERIYRSRKLPRSMTRWQEEVERTAFDLIRARLEVAIHEQRCADLIGNLPKNFDPVMFLAARLGVAVERAVLTEAERRGFYPAGTFRSYFGTPPADFEQPSDESPEIEISEEQTEVDRHAMMPNVHWHGDKLMPVAPSPSDQGTVIATTDEEKEDPSSIGPAAT